MNADEIQWSIWEGIIPILNLIPAIITAILTCAILKVYKRQTRIMKQQVMIMDKQTVYERQANETAKEATQATISSAKATNILANKEQPFLLVQIPVVTELTFLNDNFNVPNVSYTITNYGNSPAFLFSTNITFAFEENWNVIPDYDPMTLETPEFIVIAPNATTKIQKHDLDWGDGDMHEAHKKLDEAYTINPVNNPPFPAIYANRYHFYGKIQYTDVFGKNMVAGFGYMGYFMTPSSIGFKINGGHAYNYHKEEEENPT